MTFAGVGMPNRQWEPWTQAELEAVLDLAPAVLVVLLYPNDIPASVARREQLYWLLGHCASIRRVQFRPYDTRIPKRDPVNWARENWRRVQPYLAAIRETGIEVELVGKNEANLAGEAGHTDWSRHVAWDLAFGQAMMRHDPHGIVTLHLAAYSPGIPGYEAGWRAWADHAEELWLVGYHVVDAHCYSGDRSYEALHSILSGWPISLTEFNQVDPEIYLASLPDYVRDASWFILSGTEDQRLYWLLSSPWYESFKRAATREDEPMSYSVGPGVLEVMHQRGRQPASDETWIGTEVSRTVDNEGDVYFWDKATARVCVSFPWE